MSARVNLRDVARGIGLGEVGCGDNSCIWGSPGGMGTNGGCRCIDGRSGQSERHVLLQMQRVARHLLDVYRVIGSEKS